MKKFNPDSYWDFVERTANEVAKWPAWKLGGPSVRTNKKQRSKKMNPDYIEEAFTYHAPTEDQIESMKQIRNIAMDLAHTIVRECPESADRSAALRKLREVVMTANASIVLEGVI